MSIRRAWCALALPFVLAIPASGAETFNLHIYTYCAPGTLCGFSSTDHHEDHMLLAVQELNLQWEGTGFSFRPVIHPIDSSNPDYYEVTGCANRDGSKLCPDMEKSCGTDLDCTGIGDGICRCFGICRCENLATACTEDSHCAGIGGGICKTLTAQRRLRWAQDVADQNPGAISMMLTQGPQTCCSNPPSPEDPPWSIRSIFCDANRTVYDTGSVWSHEMGHYWCLRHTHTMQDMMDTYPNLPNHDGDGGHGIADTPDDPAPPEGSDRAGGLCSDGTPCEDNGDCPAMTGPCDFDTAEDLREYCFPTVYHGITSDGSPHDTACGSNCVRCFDGPCDEDGDNGNMTAVGYFPDMELAISYHDHQCRGPFVINGTHTQPFSADQFDAIADCYTDWPERSGLFTACDFLGGDPDHDGICSADDNCPAPVWPCFNDTKNTLQTDSDGDGLGDACDLCVDVNQPTGDIDKDCQGDLCDDDMDGDGCMNWEDQHPTEYQIEVGVFVHSGCSVGSESMFVHEATDSDSDSVPNCKDLDDDNDGWCDEGGPYAPDGTQGIPGGCEAYPETNEDPCPVHANNFCVFPGQVCPPEWAVVCYGPGCFNYFVLIDSVINPDPTRAVRFELFEIYNQTLFLGPLAGITTSESALALQGEVGQKSIRGRNQLPQPPLRMEIWSREPEERVAVVVDEYLPYDVIVGEIDQGRFLAVTPTNDPFSGQPRIDVASRYAMGHAVDQTIRDSDSDGRPDNMDNCLLVANFSQRDADGDGAGNACDADMDGDWMTSDADLETIRSCVGADLTLTIPVSEPEDPAEDVDGAEMELPDLIAYEFANRCRAADLNDDRIVDVEDVNMARPMVGSPPGPAVNQNLVPVADAGPDQVAACDVTTLALDGSASYDPDADPFTCQWTDYSCRYESPNSCVTGASCPHGTNYVTLVVDDGTAQSLDQAMLFFPDCNSPGRVEDSVRMGKTADDPPRFWLEWEPSCLPGHSDYGIYRGTIGSWIGHTQMVCTDDGGDLREVFDDADGDRYYLVVPNNRRAEGSYGKRSDGSERPRPTFSTVCAPAQEIDECPPSP